MSVAGILGTTWCCRWRTPTRQEYVADWTENVSAGGLFIRTEQPFARGDSVRVRLSFPGLLQAVEIEGAVAWVRGATSDGPRGIGLRVDNDVHRRRLAELALRASEAALPRQAYRVLIVEDNRLLSAMYEHVLKRIARLSGNKMEVAFATNGHEALAAVASRSVDLVITDVYMPVMDGFALARQLRSNAATRAIPTFMVTGGGAEDVQRAKAAGVDAVLHKPVQFGEMLETIVHLLKLKTQVAAE